MNLETKIIIYKFTPQVFTLTRDKSFGHVVHPAVELAPGEAQVAVRVNDIFFVWCCFGPMFQPLAEGTFV